jgi:single-strand DNA-binding protein
MGNGRTTITGRIASIETRDFENGGTIISFSIPDKEKWTGKDGAKQERTEWYRFKLSLNSKDSDLRKKFLSEALVKGSIVAVEGKQRTDEGKEGQKYHSYTVTNIDFIVINKEEQEGVSSEPVANDQPSNDDLPF